MKSFIMINPHYVTVILAIRNEADFIAESLGAVLAQDYPVNFMEILVADGLSNDATREIITNKAGDTQKPVIQIVDNPGKIVPIGLNIVLRQAKGDIIIRVDGHTSVAPDYVRQCVETLQRTNADNVGGKMSAIGNNFFGKSVALATSTPFGIGGGRFHYSNQEEWVDTVYMGAWPRRVFEKIGLFDEELVRDQDDEFNYRLREQGGHILLSPAIRSIYTVRSTPYALWRQYFEYGFWKVRVLQKHPRQMSLRQFIPPALVLALLVSFIIAMFPVIRPLSFVIPILYLFANLLASLWTALKRGWKFLPFLPIVFIILHIGYGLGFLVGLAKFWNRWGDKIGKVPVWSNEAIG
jgi:succinoglycan biosynthesis protein ExoA